LLELAGLPADSNQEGQSLVPLMKDPQKEWNHPAITSFGLGNYSVRSTRYRFIQYFDGSRELYDLSKDPHEITNLASHPEYKTKLKEMRRRLNRWMRRTNDQGRTPESPEMYDSDMEVYLQKNRLNADQTQLKTLEKNIAQMKQWASEGK